ncbi:MAG: KAP family NTPase [Dysgonamonadaceae bacterium]|nr:KAP family NTPase [Dysgonamonadaceae bacterium]
MWSDNETTEDFLGFKIHADLLLDVIKDETVLPVTIGVFGDWGSGKSSILKIIHEELKGKDDDSLKDDTLVLYFNGWVFEGYDDAKAALLESIIEQFGKHKQLKNKVKDETIKLLKSVNWMRILGLSFKKVILPTVAAYFTGGLSLVPFLLQEFSQFNAKDLSEKLTSDNAEDFLKDIIRKKGVDETSLVRDFRNDFKTMMDKSKIKRLVVMIDDLDRCTPDRIIENLEAVKLFLNVDKTAFIIGADPRIVRRAIEFRYKTDDIKNSIDSDSRNKRIVSDYLEKLIQVPYNLPKLSDREVETYMTLLFCKKEIEPESFNKILVEFYKNRTNRYGAFGLGDIQDILSDGDKNKLSKSVSLIASLSPIITDGLNGNPRQIKRFLNTFTLRKRLVDIANIPNFRIDILIKLMVLEYSELALFQKIYEWQVSQNGEPKELNELETLVQEHKKEDIKKRFSSDWASDKLIKWLTIEPKLSGTDLRDYFWISRDQLEKSISGSSLIPVHIRNLCKSLLEAGSGSILTNTIETEVIGKLDEKNLENLLYLLEKELLKAPENGDIHKVFIELMSKKVNCIDSYKRIIRQVDNTKIPFSLRHDFNSAAKQNPDIESIYPIFNPQSQIRKALNSKTK